MGEYGVSTAMVTFEGTSEEATPTVLNLFFHDSNVIDVNDILTFNQVT